MLFCESLRYLRDVSNISMTNSTLRLCLDRRISGQDWTKMRDIPSPRVHAVILVLLSPD